MEEDYLENMSELGPADVASEVLRYVEEYPDKIPEQYREITRPLLAPGARLGIANGTVVAEQVNAFYSFRSFFDVKPPMLQGAEDLMFDLVVVAIEPVLNTSRDGRLLQIVTGQRIEPDVPPWLSSLLLGGEVERIEREESQEGGE